MAKSIDSNAIYEAFMATLKKEIPSDDKEWPEWYKERMELCGKCEYNTENISSDNLKLISFAQEVIMKKHACAICNCFIKQKCWIKSQQCARKYIGKIPLW